MCCALQCERIGGGAALFFGNFISVRPTEAGLLLNLDTSAVAVAAAVSAIEFLVEKSDGRWNPRDALSPRVVRVAFNFISLAAFLCFAAILQCILNLLSRTLSTLTIFVPHL